MKQILLLILLWFTTSVHAQYKTYNPGQAFTSVAVDSAYNIWAGTKLGAYTLDKLADSAATTFTIVGGTAEFNIQTIAADNQGFVWVGHAGKGTSTSATAGGAERIAINGGGITHFGANRDMKCMPFLAYEGLATRNTKKIVVDDNGTVWSAHKYHDLSVPPDYFVTPGAFSFKRTGDAIFTSIGTYSSSLNGGDPGLPFPKNTCNESLGIAPQSRTVPSIAAVKDGVWISVYPYITADDVSYPARLLKYDLNGVYTGISATFASIGATVGGVFNGLAGTPNGDLWATMSAGKGFAVRKNGNWYYLNAAALDCIVPAGAQFNENAIWSNKSGQVFLGTNKGLIVYNGRGPVNSVSSYTLYTKENNNTLLSNNIFGGASERDSIQWIATDAGMMRSTLGGNYTANQDTLGHLACDNPIINEIYAQAEQDVRGRQDYHEYRIETIIATTEGPNGANANANFIYNMMKSDVGYSAIIPHDFPHDFLSFYLPIMIFSPSSVIDQIVANASKWEYDPVNGNENGGIKYIHQLLEGMTFPLSYNLYTPFAYRELIPDEFPFQNKISDKLQLSRDELLRLQMAANQKEVEACAKYSLYNSANFIIDRSGFRTGEFFKDFFSISCEEPLESVLYDKVWIVPDDKNLTITNYTQPGHMLYPGKIVRQVIEECGQIKVVTIGTGLSSCGDRVDGKINGNGNSISGALLFKNVDIRLKKAFESKVN